MTHIKKILFSIEFMKKYVIEYFDTPSDMPASISMFKKDVDRRALLCYMIKKHCGTNGKAIAKNIGSHASTVCDLIRRGKEIQSDDKTELERGLKRYYPTRETIVEELKNTEI